jgi:hypothetical protein
MKFAPLVATAVLAFSAFNASAVTNWAVHDAFEFGSGSAVGANTLLVDDFSFTLLAPSDVTATAVANNFGSLLLTGALVDLFHGPVGSGTSVGQFGFSGMPAGLTFLSLPVGSYYYEVTAKVGARAAAGSYTLTSQASPVPEPESIGLMLAGLAAGAVFILRRRQKN